MRENSIEVPEPSTSQTESHVSDQAATNGRKRQNTTQKGLPGRRLVEPGRSGRHATKCRICNHPDRHAIEFDFLNWRNPADLARSYNLRDLTMIYRHAHATGLFAKRRLNLRFALERIVERVNEVPVTANALIRAARAVSRINDAGEWVDPPPLLIVTHVNSEDSSSCGDQDPVGPDPHPATATATQPREAFVGRGFNCDIKRRSAKPSFQARQGDEGKVPSIPAHDARRRSLSRAPRTSRLSRDTTKIPACSARSSVRARQAGQGEIPDIAARDTHAKSARPFLIFDDALLDEPSDSAANSGELPRINGKPPEPEVILTITPEFARCREERRRAIEADLAAHAANAVTERQSEVSSPSSLPQAEVPNSAPPALNDPTRQTQTVPSQSSSLPVAAVASSATSALPHPAGFGNNVAGNNENGASPSTLLPQAAFPKPAAACPDSGRGAMQPPPAVRRAGSSGSVDPPFPFTPEPLRRWKPWRRF